MKTIYLSILLALMAILSLQAQSSIQSYEELAPSSYDYYYKPFAEQTDIFNLYAPSDITLKNHLLFANPPGPDGYNPPMPYAPDGVENGLHIPVGNGLWVLIMCLLGYAIFRRMKSYQF
jgi:hypothetical protein